MFDLPQITTGIILMLVGASFSGLALVIRYIMKMKSDIDIAFQKIRAIEGAKLCPKCSQK